MTIAQGEGFIIKKEQQRHLALQSPMRFTSAEDEIASLKRNVSTLEEKNRQFSNVIDSQRLKIDTLAQDLERQSKLVQHAAKFKEVLFRYSDLLP
jgi:predicted RNase H-like nuclease (RuvC/YqgF family)